MDQWKERYLRTLVGDLRDSDKSEEFRDNLRDELELDDIDELTNLLISGDVENSGIGLQDVVNNLAERMDFKVEYGDYDSNGNGLAYDGLWVSNNFGDRTVRLVVETKKRAQFVDPADQPGKYMDALKARDSVDAENVYGLIVVGEGDLSRAVQAVRGSEYRDEIRVITVHQLFGLVEMLEESGLAHKQAAQILSPMDTVNVGSLVQLIRRIVDSDHPHHSDVQDDEAEQTSSEDDIRSRLEEEANVVINGNGEVKLKDGDLSWAECLRRAIGIAIDEGCVTKQDLPYAAGGEVKNLINTTPERQDGEEMIRWAEVRDGFYVAGNMNKNSIKTKLEHFADDFIV